MELYALNEEVAALEAMLAGSEGTARLDLLVALAWQLRERDVMRAEFLAEQAEAELHHSTRLVNHHEYDSHHDDHLTYHHPHQARLLLVHGVMHTLRSHLDAAQQEIESAIKLFEQISDSRASLSGCGDGYCCLASVWQDRGDARQRDHCLQLAIDDYRAAGDTERQEFALARSLHYAAFRDVTGTAARLAQCFDPDGQTSRAASAWLESARAVMAVLSGDAGSAIRDFMRAYHAAWETGQIRQAIGAASNASD
ncbi:MAG: hypothetical protein RL748_1828, partial [Pseudomonadota bacterium]